MKSFETFRYDEANVTPDTITLQREGEAVLAVFVAHLRGWTYDIEQASHDIFTDALVVYARPMGDTADERTTLGDQLDQSLHHGIGTIRPEIAALDEIARAIGSLEDTAQEVVAAVLRRSQRR